MPDRIRSALSRHIDSGRIPGLVALVAHRDEVRVVVLGERSLDGPPMTRDTIFRIASLTKPILAVATMSLVEDGLLDLDAPIGLQGLPELSFPWVLRTPTSSIEDTVPAERAITPRHLLTFTHGLGFSATLRSPITPRLMSDLAQGAPTPQAFADPDEFIARASRIPLLHQPGMGWTYNTGADILGVLVSRVTDQSLEQVMRERVFDKVGMPDTGFHVPAEKLDRLVTWYLPDHDTGLKVLDEPPGEWSRPPVFQAGASGLVGTADDWLAFGRMMLAQGEAPGGRVLQPQSVRDIMANHLPEALRVGAQPFLLGRGWGYGGTVDLDEDRPGRVVGRYGWVGGTGTSGHISPKTHTVEVLMTQVQLTGPSDEAVMGAFWAANAAVRQAARAAAGGGRPPGPDGEAGAGPGGETPDGHPS